MKRYALLLFVLIALAGGMIGVVALRPVAPVAVPPPIAPPAARETVAIKPIVAPPPVAPRGPEESDAAPAEAASLPPLLGDVGQATQRIQTLASTFDPEQVPELALYLGHPAREIRRRAARGLMLLGSDTAVPALRIAAKQAEAEQDDETVLIFRSALDLLSNSPSDEPRPAPKSVDAAEREIAEMWRQKSLKPQAEATRPVGTD